MVFFEVLLEVTLGVGEVGHWETLEYGSYVVSIGRKATEGGSSTQERGFTVLMGYLTSLGTDRLFLGQKKTFIASSYRSTANLKKLESMDNLNRILPSTAITVKVGTVGVVSLELNGASSVPVDKPVAIELAIDSMTSS